MKYMNHLRKLALLSSLALSFSVAVHADGTLPLPIADGTLPLEMEDLNANLRVEIKEMKLTTIPDNINGKPACAKTEALHLAVGVVAHENKDLTLVGICKTINESPTLKTVNRTVVAIPKGQTAATASAVVRMTGAVTLNEKLNNFETFKGKMTTTALVPVSSGLSEAETAIGTPVPFEFIR